MEHQRGPTGRRLLALFAALAMVFGIQFVGSNMATANGTVYKNCAQSLTVTGLSSSGNGAQTASPTNSNPDLGCGNAYARALYQPYPGSPVYYTGWSIAAGIATANPGGTVGGNHDCGYKAPAFGGGWPFST